MAITTYDGLIARISSGHWMSQPIHAEVAAATTGVFLANNLNSMQNCGYSKVLPSPLPTGVTSYIPTRVLMNVSGTAVGYLVAKLVNLGSLDIAGPTFTDGNSMPTVTELGASVTMSSAVLVEVTTALNATPGNLQITYLDQDGNSSTNTAQAMVASSAVQSVAWAILDTGDSGVIDITNATRTGGTTPTGIVQFWGIIPLCMNTAAAGITSVGVSDNLITSGFNPVRLGAGDEIRVFTIGVTGVRGMIGEIFLVGDS